MRVKRGGGGLARMRPVVVATALFFLPRSIGFGLGTPWAMHHHHFVETKLEATRIRTMDAPPLPVVAPTSTAQSVQLPLRRAWSHSLQRNVESILRGIAESTAFLVDPVVTAKDETWSWRCTIPAFGDECSLRFDLNAMSTSSPRLVLSMQGYSTAGRADEDFGWVCTKLYEHYAELDTVVDCSTQLLQRVLVQHSNVDAAKFAWNPTQLATFERMLHSFGKRNKADAIHGFIDHLETFGYAIVDHDDAMDETLFTLRTTAAQQTQLSDYYLQDVSSQGPTVRTDRVHFLSRSEAQTCDLEPQYDLLMGLAHFLNDHLPVTEPTSPYLEPVFPATVERPLALPRSLQFAEYAHGDYYVAHSDNAVTGQFTPDNHPIRVNFRAYTCILYMNDNEWNMEQDGGALRLIPNKKDVNVLGESVEATKSADISVDIAPINGRLLIFDSRLVHSVQPVTSTKQRRALTLWIHKPNNSDVHGEGTSVTTKNHQA